MKTSRPRRRAAAVAAGVALLLSSCGETAPGAAAVVDGTAIPRDRVDAFAEVLCSLGQVSGQSDSQQPSQKARFQALQILVADQVAMEVAGSRTVDRASVNAVTEQLSANRSKIPTALRSTFDEVVQEFATAQSAILAMGRAALQKSGSKSVTDQAAFQEGSRLVADYAKKADITVDPRFGTVQDGVLRPGNGSLSVPVSDAAKEGAAATPSGSYVAQLPASQRCG